MNDAPKTESIGSCEPGCGTESAPLSAPGSTQTTLRIDKMDCPTEEGLIRGKLGGMEGVRGLEFNLMQRLLMVAHTPEALPAVLVALKGLGFEATLAGPAEAQGKSTPPPPALSRRRWWLLGIGGLAALLAEAADWGEGPQWLVIGLALLAVATGGLDTYKKGWTALRNRNLNMNGLMSVAVTGGMIIGEWPEAAMVMFLFAAAEVIEVLSLDRARHAIRKLMDLAPETAVVQQADGSWVEMPASAIPIGRIIRVRPGERVALDGQVTVGHPSINQAPITGESIPVEKEVGDPVFAGTINEAGEFEFKVTAAATDSTLSRIIHAVEAAQGSRAPTQNFVDRFAKVYTPAVFAAAIAIALLPPLAMGLPWHDWIYKALVLLVIACPCALVISTPVTIVSGLAAAARAGILVKGGMYLERGHKLRLIALDKTGTLTQGKPAVTDFIPVNNEVAKEVRRLGVSLAARSDHPISRAVAAYGAGELPLLEPVEFGALVGRGVKGRIGERTLYLGNQRLARELGAHSSDLEAKLKTLEAQGKTVVLLMEQGMALGAFGVADTLRETSKVALKELHDLDVRTVMLTGDNAQTAQAIARQVGIDDVRAELLPEHKLDAVAELARQYGEVGMVGDGINDAPALAKASVGFAMGAAGSDTALETADVALMDDDLRKLPSFIRLSKRTARVLSQNLMLALGIKAVFLGLTFTGHASMWMAVFADMGASLIVIANGSRLLAFRMTPAVLRRDTST